MIGILELQLRFTIMILELQLGPFSYS